MNNRNLYLVKRYDILSNTKLSQEARATALDALNEEFGLNKSKAREEFDVYLEEHFGLIRIK